jgi:hypothetical protein
MFETLLPEDLIADIGESIGFKMWSRRDKSIEYSYPGARGDEPGRADDFHNGTVLCSHKLYLLTFSRESYRSTSIQGCASYTLNLNTLTPTRNSRIQTPISEELKARIRAECIAKRMHETIPALCF